MRIMSGGYVVHIGVIVIGVGVAASSLFSTTVEGNLRLGESLAINQYNLTFQGLQRYTTSARQVASATMAVTEDGRSLGPMVSEKYTHRGHETPVTEVSIRTTLLEDLYVILAGAGVVYLILQAWAHRRRADEEEAAAASEPAELGSYGERVDRELEQFV